LDVLFPVKNFWFFKVKKLENGQNRNESFDGLIEKLTKFFDIY